MERTQEKTRLDEWSGLDPHFRFWGHACAGYATFIYEILVLHKQHMRDDKITKRKLKPKKVIKMKGVSHIDLINEREIAYVLYGDASAFPLIALHGWMDNAASFAVLAPLLCGNKKYCVYAIDALGCGMSSHMDTYNIWDDLPWLQAFVDRIVKRNKFALMGHSRGAFVATLFAAVAGANVEKLILLDGWPWPEGTKTADQVVDQLRDFTLKYGQHRPSDRHVKSVEQAARLRTEMTQQPLLEVCQPLMARACLPDGGRFLLSTDERQKYPSALKFSREQILAINKSVTAPILLITASQGMLANVEKREPEVLQSFRSIKVETMEGHHHLHMNEECANLLATKHIIPFLDAKII